MALENARLFDETQRLLTETNERAAELAIINSVQQGLAAKLDMQSMYDLVGDKIQEIFDAQVDRHQRSTTSARRVVVVAVCRSSAASALHGRTRTDSGPMVAHVLETREAAR